ncbi:uncharacterized protein LOC120123101 [Hibiscus syriacus]|uniref:uncharacterized protein LOC120123101 n=1 Tax=Hibiscus syriacus TaxID=106335 RepID=UPI00192497E0|nr:uncharacterized protein LOC120123101 [Hibiscus syriacus]
MEVGVNEVEDDVFFADLNKQISLLIMDDDNDEPVATYPSVSFQTFCGANYQTGRPPHLESKGTGVFIPRSLQPTRKHGQRRFTSFNNNSNRYKHNNGTKMASRQSFNDPYTSSSSVFYLPKGFSKFFCFSLSKCDHIPQKLQDGNGREKRHALELLNCPAKNIIPDEVSMIVSIAA